MRTWLVSSIIAGAAWPLFAQHVDLPRRPVSTTQSQPPEPTESKQPRTNDNAILVTGMANGARVVTVDFDKVWKTCAECKRALAKLDKLARNYRDEQNTAAILASPGATCGGARSSTVVTFQRSSAEPVGERARSPNSIADGLCAARAEDRSMRTYQSLSQKYVAPEQAKLLGYMRSFLDQLAPHVRDATEAERIVHGASVGLTDSRRTRLSAKNVKRIDVTKAVIQRLNAMEFTIALPDPPAPGSARGGYEPIR